MFAEVSFPISSYKIFTYSIPEELEDIIKPGLCVNASIGTSISSGFVIKIHKKTNYSGKIKNILSIKFPTIKIPLDLLKTIIWSSQYYLCPVGMVMKAAIPIAYNEKYLAVLKKHLTISNLGEKELKKWDNSRAPKQLSILKLLIKNSEGLFSNEICRKISNPYNAINILYKKKFINLSKREIIPQRFILKEQNYTESILTSKQQLIYKSISKSINVKRYAPFLIHGVPGSGKTEIYIKLAKKAIMEGNSVLILVPEIGLTPQLLNKFKKQFGNRIALWHSKVKLKEKGWVWRELYKGNFDIIIGVRSAIFLPIKNLGLIIIDEEHDTSYKQSNPQPRYNARDIALVRGNISKIVVVLGSATPSMETYYNCLRGKIEKINLDDRYGQSIKPKIEVVNMSKFNSEIIISPLLINRIKNCLDNGEQIIIFHNRRGYSTIQKCLNCNIVSTCTNCSVNLTYHKSNNSLVCHHCQTSYSTNFKCNKCNSKDIKLLGVGTQKVENQLAKIFPKATLLRMDSDVMKTEKHHVELIEKYENQKADILIGTQMVSKGLDFENVTLVGVINADVSLSSPDFRTGERIFQLLYQVCGRSGRHKKNGCAIIQSYNPTNQYIKLASKLDINKYYNIELSNRLELNYPPATKIVKIIIKGKNLTDVILKSKQLKNKLLKNKMDVLGPIPAPLEKIKLYWRYIIIIKDNKEISMHSSIINAININEIERYNSKTKIQIDVDPISLL